MVLFHGRMLGSCVSHIRELVFLSPGVKKLCGSSELHRQELQKSNIPDNNRLRSQVLGLQPSDTHPPTSGAVLPPQMESSGSPLLQPLSSFEMLGSSDPGFGFSSDLNYTLLKSLLILPHGCGSPFLYMKEQRKRKFIEGPISHVVLGQG